MKFFLDTADLDEIREAASWGVVAGVTTNPSLYAKIGGKLADFENHIARICEIVDGPVSAETTAMTRDQIVADGRRLAAIAPNVVVKIPVMAEGLAATKQLASEGIAVNMTLVFGHEVEIIAASVRSPHHVTQAALMGADIATVPFGALKKCIEHPLTDRGLERFLADWKKVEQA